MSALVFVVPMPETLTNSGKGRSRHWWAAHREKTAYWRRLDYIASYLQASMVMFTDTSMVGLAIPRAPASPLTRVSIRSTMYLGGAMDEDNAMARHKPLLDWLKKRRYLVDDRKKNIKWEGFPEQVVKRDGNYRIELVVTPL